MEPKNFLSSLVITAGLTCFTLAGPAWGQAGCIDPMPLYPDPSDPIQVVDPNDTEYVIPAPTVSAFGSNLTCDDISGQFGGKIPNGSGAVTFQNSADMVQFTVESTLSNGIAVWNVVPPEEAPGPVGWTVLRAIDTSITDAAQGGNGCLVSHGADALAGQLAWRKSNGTNTLRNLYVCADNTFDPVGTQPAPSVEPVKGCTLEDMQSKTIYGVTVVCQGVPMDEQRTIFVSKDTELNVDTNNIDPVAGFGFLNEEGEIDFSNVCVCNGPTSEFEQPQCDPNPDQVNDPILDALEPCTVNNADVSVNIEIQNPRCVTVGGRRRCY
jgi:hypothetical protein